ncbi:hypothetical protein QA641_23710 [Bradyrhizobium sp. CB1650]|uniref:hypothetical protein n=1 Tax=Bradyrhizobium sp. CB1650 TaxID=3039153 RepID=UPI002435F678|nr:hypothetical protein [Bradyrhizobium sp. CB1650]WGD48659.1 hypothetical protein QA641_23710 [Bradyrhizobium sp. CB1650]
MTVADQDQALADMARHDAFDVLHRRALGPAAHLGQPGRGQPEIVARDGGAGAAQAIFEQLREEGEVIGGSLAIDEQDDLEAVSKRRPPDRRPAGGTHRRAQRGGHVDPRRFRAHRAAQGVEGQSHRRAAKQCIGIGARESFEALRRTLFPRNEGCHRPPPRPRQPGGDQRRECDYRAQGQIDGRCCQQVGGGV